MHLKNIKMKTINNILILMIGIAVSACSNSSSTQKEEHAHHSSNVVTLNLRQIKTLNLKYGPIEQKNIGAKIQINGTLEVPPQSKADISPLKGGVIKKIYVIEGDKVRKGQVLATMQHPDFIDLQSSYSTNINELAYLEKEFNRQKKLNEEKVTSDKVFQKIESDYRKLKGTVQAQKVQLQLLGINPQGVAEGKIYSSVNITSPFNGFVSAVETNIGAYVEPMSKLFQVVNTNDMHADFMIYEKDIDKISVGQKIEFSTLNSSKINQASVHNISPVFESEPKALHIHADIESDKGQLIPGMYIKGNVTINNYLTTAVPEEAIVEESGKYFVFIKSSNVKEGNKQVSFVKTQVSIGLITDGYTEISFLEEVNANAEIAYNGAYFLLSEMTKDENEHDH
jgi:cobalt-zinc-cadmium efflux system membrane fusion protein